MAETVTSEASIVDRIPSEDRAEVFSRAEFLWRTLDQLTQGQKALADAKAELKKDRKSAEKKETVRKNEEGIDSFKQTVRELSAQIQSKVKCELDDILDIRYSTFPDDEKNKNSFLLKSRKSQLKAIINESPRKEKKGRETPDVVTKKSEPVVSAMGAPEDPDSETAGATGVVEAKEPTILAESDAIGKTTPASPAVVVPVDTSVSMGEPAGPTAPTTTTTTPPIAPAPPSGPIAPTPSRPAQGAPTAETRAERQETNKINLKLEEIIASIDAGSLSDDQKRQTKTKIREIVDLRTKEETVLKESFGGGLTGAYRKLVDKSALVRGGAGIAKAFFGAHLVGSSVAGLASGLGGVFAPAAAVSGAMMGLEGVSDLLMTPGIAFENTRISFQEKHIAKQTKTITDKLSSEGYKKQDGSFDFDGLKGDIDEMVSLQRHKIELQKQKYNLIAKGDKLGRWASKILTATGALFVGLPMGMKIAGGIQVAGKMVGTATEGHSSLWNVHGWQFMYRSGEMEQSRQIFQAVTANAKTAGETLTNFDLTTTTHSVAGHAINTHALGGVAAKGLATVGSTAGIIGGLALASAAFGLYIKKDAANYRRTIEVAGKFGNILNPTQSPTPPAPGARSSTAPARPAGKTPPATPGAQATASRAGGGAGVTLPAGEITPPVVPAESPPAIPVTEVGDSEGDSGAEPPIITEPPKEEPVEGEAGATADETISTEYPKAGKEVSFSDAETQKALDKIRPIIQNKENIVDQTKENVREFERAMLDLYNSDSNRRQKIDELVKGEYRRIKLTDENTVLEVGRTNENGIICFRVGISETTTPIFGATFSPATELFHAKWYDNAETDKTKKWKSFNFKTKPPEPTAGGDEGKDKDPVGDLVDLDDGMRFPENEDEAKLYWGVFGEATEAAEKIGYRFKSKLSSRGAFNNFKLSVDEDRDVVMILGHGVISVKKNAEGYMLEEIIPEAGGSSERLGKDEFTWEEFGLEKGKWFGWSVKETTPPTPPTSDPVLLERFNPDTISERFKDINPDRLEIVEMSEAMKPKDGPMLIDLLFRVDDDGKKPILVVLGSDDLMHKCALLDTGELFIMPDVNDISPTKRLSPEQAGKFLLESKQYYRVKPE